MLTLNGGLLPVANRLGMYMQLLTLREIFNNGTNNLTRHMTSGKCLSWIKEEGKHDPQLYSLDFSPNSTSFAVAGSEPVVSIINLD